MLKIAYHDPTLAFKDSIMYSSTDRYLCQYEPRGGKQILFAQHGAITIIYSSDYRKIVQRSLDKQPGPRADNITQLNQDK